MEFQDHHVVSRNLSETSRLLNALNDRGLFNLDAPENRIKLPSDRADARALEKSAHNGRPLSSYEDGVKTRLKTLEASDDFKKMIDGDDSAAKRLADKVNNLRDAVKDGLDNGQLHTNRNLEDPKQGKFDANKKNKKWFDTFDDAVKRGDLVDDAAKAGSSLLDDFAKGALRVAGKIAGALALPLDMVLSASPAGEGSDLAWDQQRTRDRDPLNDNDGLRKGSYTTPSPIADRGGDVPSYLQPIAKGGKGSGGGNSTDTSSGGGGSGMGSTQPRDPSGSGPAAMRIAAVIPPMGEAK